MATDKEAIGLSRVKLYYSKCNLPHNIFVDPVLGHTNTTSMHTISRSFIPYIYGPLGERIIGLCREPSSRPQDGSLRSRTGGFVDTRPRAVVGKQDGLMPVLGRAA